MSKLKTLDSELLNAVKEYRLEDARTLIKEGAWVGATNRSGFGVLHLVVAFPTINDRDKLLELAKMLIQYGAPVNVKTKTDGLTPLHYAVVCMQLNIGKLLVEHGADINVKDNHGNSPIQLGGSGSKQESKALTGELTRFFHEHRAKIEAGEIASGMAQPLGEDKPAIRA